MSVLEVAPDKPSTAPLRRWTLSGALTRGCLLGLLLCLAVEIGNHLFACNAHAVIPGTVYRSAQPSGDDLGWLVRRYGIRTVVNLRGFRDSLGWYQDECRVAHRMNVSVEDISLSAGHLPPAQEIRQLVEVLDGCEYPVLFHCYRGVDRTGLASVVVLLLRTDQSLDEARRALSLRYVHLPFGRTGKLDWFFDLYEDWLQQNGRSHARENFRLWATHEYRGGPCNAWFEPIGPVRVGPTAVPWTEARPPWLDRAPHALRGKVAHIGDRPEARARGDAVPALALRACVGGRQIVEPDRSADRPVSRAPAAPQKVRVPRGIPFALTVRAHNTSRWTWQLHPDVTAGFHVLWVLRDARDQYLSDGRAGRFHAEVPPGGSIEVSLPLPPLRAPGRYSLQVGMIEEQHCFFHQVASEPLDLELEVP
jgi:protein tyrosine phosphatase (PTP) superfamily phosphohydrolase (DUF442 family)